MPGSSGLDPDPKKTAREQKRRNLAIAAILLGLVVLFYVMTMVRVHP